MTERGVHDHMLEEGPRQAPEPETAEQRSRRLGLKSGAGAVAAGGAAALKFGGLAKVLVWLVAFHGIVNAWRLGSWIGIAVVLALGALLIALRSRRKEG